ncbi:MAG: hypothetical protein NT149_02570 [Candidatus Gottesmanbacteria bacterium]|nr:hypothetical protein [Candidatus Gottesmanbacteria bacterium]
MPYPSYMPGNCMYKVSRILDRLKFYWSRGNIAQIKYHLALSDKYLIEAKTLMEYKQYLLGTDALRRSDKEFMQLPAYVAGAKKEGVNVSELERLISDAAEKHAQLLAELLISTPNQFMWSPEKSKPTELPLGEMLKTSVVERQHIASETASL